MSCLFVASQPDTGTEASLSLVLACCRGASLVGRMATVPRLSGAGCRGRHPFPPARYQYPTGAEMGRAPCSSVARVAPALSNPAAQLPTLRPPASSVSHSLPSIAKKSGICQRGRNQAKTAITRRPTPQRRPHGGFLALPLDASDCLLQRSASGRLLSPTSHSVFPPRDRRLSPVAWLSLAPGPPRAPPESGCGRAHLAQEGAQHNWHARTPGPNKSRRVA